MIKNFEEITHELTWEERKLLPSMVKFLSKFKEKNPIKEPEIVAHFNQKNIKFKMTGARLRKMVNCIRVNGMLPLIATHKGYFVSYDANTILSQIKSLVQRAQSINQSAEGLLKFHNTQIAKKNGK